MAKSFSEVYGGGKEKETTNKVGTFESMLAGVGSGLLAIPKGLFSLGATLMDLGVNSGKAAEVEQWFDDLTEWDEKAEATAAGKITELLVNIGVPGGIGFKVASGIAKQAMVASKTGKYLKLNTPTLKKGVQKAAELNDRGKTNQFFAGAIGGGLAEGVFIGDVEKAGSFGDLLGGPTEISRGDDPDAVRDLLNRVKFGTEGALFTGILGGIGKGIKKVTSRTEKLDVVNSKIDRLIDKFASGFRARSGKTQIFFDMERTSKGLSSGDAMLAKNASREVDTTIDAIFAPWRTIANKQTAAERKKMLKEIQKLLLSGDPKIVPLKGRVLNVEGRKLYEAYKKASFDPVSKRGMYKTEEDFLNDLIAGKSQPVMTVTDAGPGVRQTSTDGALNLKKYTETGKAGRFKAEFGDLNPKLKREIAEKLMKAGASDEQLVNIFANLSKIRERWSDLFTKLGRTLEPEELAEFKKYFGDKFSGYLGSTYDIFQNKSIIPWLRYKPTAEAIEETKQVFMKSARDAGESLTDLQAEQYVADILVEGGHMLPKGMRMDRPTDAIFKVPGFFANRTVLKEAATKRGSPFISIGQVKDPEIKEVFNRLLGKQYDPMQTMIGGMAKLSILARRNIFFDDLMKKNDELIAAGKKPLFVKTNEEAMGVWGAGGSRQIRVDQARTLAVESKAGASNPFQRDGRPMYASNGVADALEQASLGLDGSGPLGRLYESLVLYPKATSQIAKTILSPITHARNFISAASFAAANGIIPVNIGRVPITIAGKETLENPMKLAYQALQTGLKGTRQQNELYERLLELGVVNSNVRLGDLSRLLRDVNFGETMTSDKGLRLLLKPLSKLKSVGQDLYTAEDDFWKIYSWAVEKSRIAKAFEKQGLVRGKYFTDSAGRSVKLTEDWLEREAADIVKNNIPNYDFVPDFIKSLRRLPIGNFVAFPAEIARTGTNIVRRALHEINSTITLANGKVVKPFETIGYTRLFGFGATVAAVPYATTKIFQGIYDVTNEEREAIRRYVAKWSKNSTLLPIKDEEGNYKYIDFSHANAYDTLIRPIQSVINAVAEGRTDNDGIMDDFMRGVFVGMKEFGEPFISESIWTEAAMDVLPVMGRGGRTVDGVEIYSDKDTDGTKMSKVMAHLVKAQMPFSISQLKRMDQSIEAVDVLIKGKYDERGVTYDFGDEFGGMFGFRTVKIDPGRSIKYKVADFKRGVRDSGGLFTRVSLKGGPIEPREIVDAYIDANRALFGVKQNFKQDIDAARLLGISDEDFNSGVDISNVELGAIDGDIFRPLNISDNVREGFARNAENLGVSNPLDAAEPVIAEIQAQLAEIPLNIGKFPDIENPMMPSGDQRMLPNINMSALNLPNVDANLVANQGGNIPYNQLTTQQKIDILFGRG